MPSFRIVRLVESVSFCGHLTANTLTQCSSSFEDIFGKLCKEENKRDSAFQRKDYGGCHCCNSIHAPVYMDRKEIDLISVMQSMRQI